ncbi:hypothetical protein MKW94_011733 [Papaver nudicaule]|uniref:Uncharacterized protein n=1 Tax=Papaver nudicaule TaxID=74823 RepID=A0AA41VJ69_PAPNU|nr:hypothetical protein [Papaver nudicaule]
MRVVYAPVLKMGPQFRGLGTKVISSRNFSAKADAVKEVQVSEEDAKKFVRTVKSFTYGAAIAEAYDLWFQKKFYGRVKHVMGYPISKLA